MQMPSDTLYYRFECKLFSKLAKLAKVAVISAEDDLQIEFQVPRHVSNYVELDNEKAYKFMIAAAINCKDPKINLAVVQFQENDSKVSDTEDDKKKKKRTRRSPRLRAMPMLIPCQTMQSSVEKGTVVVPLLRFCRSVSQLMQQINRYLPPPTINVSFDGLADLLRPAPAPAASPPHHTNKLQMLLPPNTQPREPMSISMFCVTYNLDDSILEKLTTNRYKMHPHFGSSV
ncbi:hypothetical protein B0H14DRAFT_3143803 [Mycena olivaceomarginata]|nr:hypothetical protein B0H14DRAFT_3143803 [Mycena olivaceomarginata]